MRARFGITCHLDYYDVATLIRIVKRSAAILKVEITEKGAAEIARRSRGTPCIANALLRRVRDFAQVKAMEPSTKKLPVLACRRCMSMSTD